MAYKSNGLTKMIGNMGKMGKVTGKRMGGK